MYYIMGKSYYVMHKLLRYAKNVLRYAVIITLCGNDYVMRRHNHACQSGNMAIVLTSILFVFEISILPKYRVHYYDYTIKWCFGYK